MDEQNEQNQQPPDQPTEPGPIDTPEPIQPPAPEPAPPGPVTPPGPYVPPVTPPPPGPGAPGPAAPSDTNTLFTLGLIFGIIALLGSCCCCSIPFALASVVLGIVILNRGDQRGLWVVVIGAIALLSGGGFTILFGSQRWGQPPFLNRWPMSGRPV